MGTPKEEELLSFLLESTSTLLHRYTLPSFEEAILKKDGFNVPVGMEIEGWHLASDVGIWDSVKKVYERPGRVCFWGFSRKKGLVTMDVALSSERTHVMRVIMTKISVHDLLEKVGTCHVLDLLARWVEENLNKQRMKVDELEHVRSMMLTVRLFLVL